MADEFIQPPDTNPTGLGVFFSQYATYFRKLADDWACTETGEISKVTLWVSFIGDVLPQEGLTSVRLSVHADTPADPRSKPGPLLAQWDLAPSQFALVPHGLDVSGKFWDPVLGQREMGAGQRELAADMLMCRIDCFVPEGQRFLQREGTVYWLGAFVTTGDGGVATLCGWKTSPGGRTPGAAVWTDDPEPVPPPASWTAMQYPAWHRRSGAPLNLAFAIEAAPPAASRAAATPPPPAAGAPLALGAAPCAPPAPVAHPADADPGAPRWRCSPAEVLACAAGWLSGATPEFRGVPLDGPGAAQAYILRAAAIALANYQARYEDAGGAEPINSAAYPRRWRELPDA